MSTYPGQQPTLIYQADPAVVHHVRKVRDTIHTNLKPCLNRRLRVQTMDGTLHEGVLSGYDSSHLYLTVPAAPVPATARAFFPPPRPPYPPYAPPPPPPPVNPGSAVLPLVLYSLLAISLI
ncbi:hypothetical protein [Paenibacillus glufosinatiresistens]|uniref:hypothetical protein n=1 Tax=Paenibacillus glufosinatiresistens TaxID=3070657 RepID=UPI00286E86C5|nr:hypothetical protein [Paenibacillus sp. YX.27]